MKIPALIMILLCIIILPASSIAGDFDGSKPLICSTMEAIQCIPGELCNRVKPEDINFPLFLKVNFKDKTISGLRKDGELLSTNIKTMERENGNLIMQGIQNGKAWSMIITEATGKMDLTVSGDQIGFIVFGASIPQ